MQVNLERVDYAGFWVRFFAFLLDNIILGLVLGPFAYMLLGPAYFEIDTAAGMSMGSLLINVGLPLLFVVIFWRYKSATPGKIMMGLIVIDADTGGTPPTPRLVLRYLGYYVSALLCGLGFIWIAFDRRKQGFHDKIARTLVVRKPPEPAAVVPTAAIDP